MDGGVLVALLGLGVLLVGVPSLARRRAELAAWHGAGAPAPRGRTAAPSRGTGSPAPAGDGDREVPERAWGTAATGAVVLGPSTPGARRVVPGARVLERRSAVPRPRCGGSGSRPVLLVGRPVPAPTTAPTTARVSASTTTASATTPGTTAGDEVGTALLPATVVVEPEGRSARDPGAARCAALGSPAGPSVTAGSARASLPATSLPATSHRRRPRRAAVHGAVLVVLLVAAVATAALALLGLVPAAAAGAPPVLLAGDLVLLRRRAVTRCRASRASSPAGGADVVVTVLDRAPEDPQVLLELDDGAAGAGAPPPRTGVVTGPLTPLADLRAAAAAEAAEGVRGPAGASPGDRPPEQRLREAAPPVRRARRRRSA